MDIIQNTLNLLGECPVWLEMEDSIAWVDIGKCAWHRFHIGSGQLKTHVFDTALTAFAPCETGGFVGAFADGLAFFDDNGQREPFLHQPEVKLVDNRFNDAGTDPAGRFLAGSMNKSGVTRSGSLYALHKDLSLVPLMSGISIANTVAFSPTGNLIYTADSATGVLRAFEYDIETGTIGPQDLTFAPASDLPGTPDGSAMDVEGFLWNARWDGGCILRLAPDGRVDRKLDLPVMRPTSCAFVGSALYITTATWELSDAALTERPASGALLRVEVGIEGAPLSPFRGCRP